MFDFLGIYDGMIAELGLILTKREQAFQFLIWDTEFVKRELVAGESLNAGNEALKCCAESYLSVCNKFIKILSSEIILDDELLNKMIFYIEGNIVDFGFVSMLGEASELFEFPKEYECLLERATNFHLLSRENDIE